ncbi:MAG: EF-hand domain-containing protein, partial [Pacificimonas sp.]
MKTEFLVAASIATLMASGAFADHHSGAKRGAEMTRADVEQRVADRFAELDADGDGAVTTAEAEAAREARMTERFARMDANDDGALDSAEWTERRGKRAERMAKRADRMAGERAERMQARMAEREERRAEMFSRLDADSDGRITETEFADAQS